MACVGRSYAWGGISELAVVPATHVSVLPLTFVGAGLASPATKVSPVGSVSVIVTDAPAVSLVSPILA